MVGSAYFAGVLSYKHKIFIKSFTGVTIVNVFFSSTLMPWLNKLTRLFQASVYGIHMNCGEHLGPVYKKT